MCKAHSKVTHIKQQKYFHHLKRPGYNTEFLLYPRSFCFGAMADHPRSAFLGLNSDFKSLVRRINSSEDIAM